MRDGFVPSLTACWAIWRTKAARRRFVASTYAESCTRTTSLTTRLTDVVWASRESPRSENTRRCWMFCWWGSYKPQVSWWQPVWRVIQCLFLTGFSEIDCSVRAGSGRGGGGGQRCDHGSPLQVHLRQRSHRPHPYMRHPLPHLPPRSALALVSSSWPNADEPSAGQHPTRWPARPGRQSGRCKAAQKDIKELGIHDIYPTD